MSSLVDFNKKNCHLVHWILQDLDLKHVAYVQKINNSYDVKIKIAIVIMVGCHYPA